MEEQLFGITENEDQCFLWRSKQLSYIAQDRRQLPWALANKFGPLAARLDLSYNKLSSCKHLNLFTNLTELILDNNLLDDQILRETFRRNLRLKILSLNKNRLTNLPRLIDLIKMHFPNLELLSLIGNPLCPYSRSIGEAEEEAGGKFGKSIKELPHAEYLDERGLTLDRQQLLSNINHHHHHPPPSIANPDFAYQEYRYFIIYHMPNLRFLDSKPINDVERDESLRRCFWG